MLEKDTEKSMAAFEHEGAIHIYDLDKQKMLEVIYPLNTIQDTLPTISSKVQLQNIYVKSPSQAFIQDSSRAVAIENIPVCGQPNTLAQSVGLPPHNSGEIDKAETYGITQKVNISEGACEYERDSGMEKTGSIVDMKKYLNKQEFLPQAFVANEMVVSREKRIGVEYILFKIGVLVCIYDEKVKKIFKHSGVVENTFRQITSILSKTVITRRNPYQQRLKNLQFKYKTNLYLLRKIDSLFYFSEIVFSEIQEENKKVLVQWINYSQHISAIVLVAFLLFSTLIRVARHKNNSIIILPGRYGKIFQKGLLFGDKPVHVLVLSKKVSTEMATFKNILLLKKHQMQDETIYIEEAGCHYYIAYPINIVTLEDAEEVKATHENRRAVGINLIRHIQSLHSKGFAQFTFSMDSILVNIQTNAVLIVGLDKMILEKKGTEDPDKNKEESRQKKVDYRALGEIYYSLYKCIFDTIHLFRNKPFSAVCGSIENYNYRKNPKFIISTESKQQVEILDWISHLLSDRQSANLRTFHPIFWSSAQALEFICLFSDFIFDHPNMLVLESSRIFLEAEVDYSNWDIYLDITLQSHLTKNGKYYYNPKVLRDLFRLIRNNRRHFQSISEKGRSYFNNEISIYTAYFFNKYPYIVLLSYYIAQEYSIIINSKIFKEIF